MTTLEGQGLVRVYGGVRAVDAVDVVVRPGLVTALIGPNGAGKTTLFACLSGTERVDGGRVLLDGEDITRVAPEARARRGIGRTFQRLAVFPTLSVADNLLVGAESRRRGSVVRGLLGLRERTEGEHRDRVSAVLDLLELGDVRNRPAGDLSTGGQRLVELGRALCGDPRVLLLDEPASGLDTGETQKLQGVLREVASGGVGVLLVEHDVGLVLGAADHVYAMADGRMLASGTPEQVRTDPAVRAAYLERSTA